MSFTIKVDMPNLSPGTKVQVRGLGMLENGKTVRVSDEQADMFRQLNGTPVTESGKTTFRMGPALDEAHFPEGVTVTKEGTDTQKSEEGAS